MRLALPLALASILLLSAFAPALAQAGTGTIELRVRSLGGDAAFSFTATGASMPSPFVMTTLNGHSNLSIGGLDAPGTARTLAATEPSGWDLAGAECTRGTPANIVVQVGATTVCEFRFVRDRDRDHDRGDDDDGDDDDDRDDRARGGGLGFWKSAQRRLNVTLVDGWVRNASASSAWLMPAGYAENAAGARALIQDASRDCKRHERLECEALRFEARYLALRLNVEAGAVDTSDTVRLNNATRTFLGLPRVTTVGEVIGAIEMKAGGASETAREIRLLRDAAKRADAHGHGDD